MKIIKTIIVVILIFTALFLLVALVLPSEYKVERSIMINKSPEFVYSIISDFKNWPPWDPWLENEPEAKYKITNPGNRPGSVMSWEGEIIGKGKQTIKVTNAPEYFETELEFMEPYKTISTMKYTVEATDSGSKVTWINVGESSYPLERYFTLFIDSMLGPDFERGLANLKEYAEALEEAPASDVNITIEDFESKRIYAIADTCPTKREAINNTLTSAFEELSTFLNIAKGNAIDRPIVIINNWSPEQYEFIAGFPVEGEPVQTAGRVFIYDTYGGKVAKGVHVGPYSGIAKTHNIVYEYVKANNLTIMGPPMEEFVDDPNKTDADKLRTIVYYPVRVEN